jgi:hypothetical protein
MASFPSPTSLDICSDIFYSVFAAWLILCATGLFLDLRGLAGKAIAKLVSFSTAHLLQTHTDGLQIDVAYGIWAAALLFYGSSSRHCKSHPTTSLNGFQLPLIAALVQASDFKTYQQVHETGSGGL